MTTAYATFIKRLRERGGYSQTDIAVKIGIARTSYIAIEKGTKELSLSEADSLSRLFGVTIDELLQNRIPDVAKYTDMILAYLRAAKEAGIVVKKTKLAKLLYLADFAWFYSQLESMSGMSYRRKEFGPVPSEYFTALEDLERHGRISIQKKQHQDGYDMYEIEETRGSARREITTLSKDEQTLIAAIWHKWQDATTSDIVSFTHEQLPYKLSFDEEVIPYELITQESPNHVY